MSKAVCTLSYFLLVFIRDSEVSKYFQVLYLRQGFSTSALLTILRFSFLDIAEIYYVSENSDHECLDYGILDEFSPNQE